MDVSTKCMIESVTDGVWLGIFMDAGLTGRVEEALSSQYANKAVDTSDIAMSRLFDYVDTDSKGALSWPQFVEGIQRCTRVFGRPRDLDLSSCLRPLWELASRDDLMSANNFMAIVRRLKMEILLFAREGPLSLRRRGILPMPDSSENLPALRCYDFTRFEVHEDTIREKDMRRFLYRPSDPSWKMQWIVADWNDRINLLRMACKYSIHCLYVADMLQLATQKPKIMKQGRSYFVITPLLQLSPQTEEARQALLSEAPAGRRVALSDAFFGIGLEEANIAVFLTGLDDNTVLTVRTSWRRVRNKASKAALARHRRNDKAGRSRWSKPSRTSTSTTAMQIAKPTIDTQDSDRASSYDLSITDTFNDPDEDDGEVESEDPAFDTKTLHEVSEALLNTDSSNSSVPFWLLHAILDQAVDRLGPVVEVYQARVRWYQDSLHDSRSRSGKKRTKEIMDLKTDIMWIQQQVWLHKPVIKQLLRVVSNEGDLLTYYQDLDDHVDRCLETLSALTALSQSLIDESHAFREDRANDILLVVTIITTIFSPAAFVAGVYGMNFTDEMGLPSMPELLWTNGYLWFWTWAISLLLGMVLFIRWKFGFSIFRGAFLPGPKHTANQAAIDD